LELISTLYVLIDGQLSKTFFYKRLQKISFFGGSDSSLSGIYVATASYKYT